MNHLAYFSSAAPHCVCRLKGQSFADLGLCGSAWLCCLWALEQAVIGGTLGQYTLPAQGCQHRWLRSSTAARALAALQAHFHSQPGLGAPLILLDKTQHESVFVLFLSQVQLSSHSLASSVAHCYTPQASFWSLPPKSLTAKWQH